MLDLRWGVIKMFRGYLTARNGDAVVPAIRVSSCRTLVACIDIIQYSPTDAAKLLAQGHKVVKKIKSEVISTARTVKISNLCAVPVDCLLRLLACPRQHSPALQLLSRHRSLIKLVF